MNYDTASAHAFPLPVLLNVAWILACTFVRIFWDPRELNRYMQSGCHHWIVKFAWVHLTWSDFSAIYLWEVIVIICSTADALNVGRLFEYFRRVFVTQGVLKHFTHVAFCFHPTGIQLGLLSTGRIAGKECGRVRWKPWLQVQLTRLCSILLKVSSWACSRVQPFLKYFLRIRFAPHLAQRGQGFGQKQHSYNPSMRQRARFPPV